MKYLALYAAITGVVLWLAYAMGAVEEIVTGYRVAARARRLT